MREFLSSNTESVLSVSTAIAHMPSARKRLKAFSLSMIDRIDGCLDLSIARQDQIHLQELPSISTALKCAEQRFDGWLDRDHVPS